MSIVLLFITVVSLNGCLLRRGYNDLACEFGMTKWEADGYELYIDEDLGLDNVFICHLDDGRTMTYSACIDVLYSITMVDPRKPLIEMPQGESSSYKYYLFYYQFGHFEYDINFFRTSLTLKYIGNDDGVSPEWLWEGAPEKELKFKLTKKNLKKEDIPEVEFDPALDYCPVFFPGSEWLSDDGKVSIAAETCSIDPPDFYARMRSFAGKATFLGENPEEYSVVFGQLDTKLYIGNLLSDQEDAICDRTLAEEVWQCEYAEDHFVAEVIKSNRYPVGTILVFTKTK